jgi:hypothetical protein
MCCAAKKPHIDRAAIGLALADYRRRATPSGGKPADGLLQRLPDLANRRKFMAK